MATVLEDFQQKQKTLSRIRDNVSRLEGQETNILDTLKRRFDVNSLAEASKLLEKLKEDHASTEAEVGRLLDEVDSMVKWDQLQ